VFNGHNSVVLHGEVVGGVVSVSDSKLGSGVSFRLLIEEGDDGVLLRSDIIVVHAFGKEAHLAKKLTSGKPLHMVGRLGFLGDSEGLVVIGVAFQFIPD
jgi:hypothetical protein